MSSNGSMRRLRLSSTSESTVALQDGFATGRSQPVIDTIQNVALLNSSETNGWTTLELKRNLTACESNDRDIEVHSCLAHYVGTHVRPSHGEEHEDLF